MNELGRAYSWIEIKSVDEESRTIEGIASSPSIDRVGDIVEPMGARFKLPLPLLLDHNHAEQVGHVEFAKPTKSGIPFKATIKKIPEPGEVQQLVDKAWHLVKYKLRSAVSIGFRAMEGGVELLKTGGYRFTDWEWYELSLVSIPAQPDAILTSIKSFDDAALALIKQFDTSLPAASGPVVRWANKPAASGNSRNIISKGTPMKNIGAQIAALEETRKEKASALEAIQTKALNEGRSKTAEERTAFDEVKAELQTIVNEIADLKALEELTVATTAKAVETGGRTTIQNPTTPARAKKKEEPGVAFARMAKVKARSRLDMVPELVVAEKMYGRESDTYHFVKAGEVAPGASVSGNWAADLVAAESGPVADFAEYLNERTILGRFGQNGIPALNRVSFRAPLLIQTEDGDGYWVGEAKPKPLTAFDFDRNTLTPLKCANIAVLSMEHIRDSSPSSDVIVRNALVAALVKVQDTAFIDPTNQGAAGVRPASVLYQAPAIATAGADYDDADLDIRSIMQKFIDARNPLTSGVWVMSPGNAVALSMLRNELGQYVFGGIGINGGTLMQLPVITSEHAGTNVALINANDIHYGDEGDVTVDVSREASLEMKAPGSNLTQDPLAPGTGSAMVSLWQNNLVGMLAEKTVNWRRRRPVSAAYLTSVAWGGAVNVS